MAEFVERRQYPRQRAAWTAAVVPGSTQEPRRIDAECIDLSGAGMALWLGQQLPAGERVTVFLAPPGGIAREARMLRFAATVVYVRPDGPRFRTGLRLVENQSLDKLRPSLRPPAPAATGTGPGPAPAPAPAPVAAGAVIRPTPVPGVAAAQRPAAPSATGGGMLQRIKAAAEERLADIEMSAQLKECLQQDWQRQVDAALRPVSQYFSELAHSFDILKPKLANGFSVPCVTVLRDLTWVESRADSRSRKSASEIQLLESISLSYRWRGQPPKLRVVLRQDEGKLGEQSLERCGIPSHVEKVEAANGTTEVALSFPTDLQCLISLVAEDEARCFRLRLVNVEAPGAVEYGLPPERLDDVLLDEVVRAVVGERSALAALLGKPRR